MAHPGSAIRAFVVALLGVVASQDTRTDAIPAIDPFSFLSPTVQIGADERQQLDAREIVLKILPASGHELAVFAAGSVHVDGDTLVARVKDIVGLKKGTFVPQIGRFSARPQLRDLSGLTLDTVDLEAIRKCHVGDCALKLGAAEIESLQRTMGPNRESPPVNVIEQAFRRIMLERVTAYLQRGQHGIPRYENDDRQVDLTSIFSALLQHSPYLQSNTPQLATYLQRYPAMHLRGVESFLYWSKETVAPKPIISVTHVNILRGDPQHGSPEVLIASREVFATHYTNGALALTLLLRAADTSSPRYLVYVNRTSIDGVRALWRPIVEHRVKSQAAKVFTGARDRIESAGARASGNRSNLIH